MTSTILNTVLAAADPGIVDDESPDEADREQDRPGEHVEPKDPGLPRAPRRGRRLQSSGGREARIVRKTLWRARAAFPAAALEALLRSLRQPRIAGLLPVSQTPNVRRRNFVVIQLAGDDDRHGMVVNISWLGVQWAWFCNCITI